MTPEITSQTHSPNCRFYTVSFFGSPISVTVTSSASVVRKWLSTTIFHRRHYVGRLVVCVGVQWNPFKSDCLSADTLQLCVGGHCLIFKLSLATRVPRLLRRFLLDTRNTLVGLWNGSDEKMLRNCDHGLLVHRLVDLRRYVENEDGKSLSNASVENIVEECLGYEGFRLEKDISMSDWDDVVLSNDQVLQASVDAHVAFRIGKELRGWEL
ncbi:uncharacterized protein LOC8265050 [Ricinus communis]|uniref:uncharacterized protein LOC8265050 n=1 Tax=Ricinus communis TaxID=3988 RepID=UPI00201B0C8A|nr:uncharacterized protein LOC8265050 [Ricinus communis]